jgi:hypothetical protein
MPNIKKWTAPANFRAGDTVDLKGWTGGKHAPKLMDFRGMNLAELIKWRLANKQFVSPRQQALFSAAQNVAMTAADPTFRNHYDEEHGIRDPETGKWLQKPGERPGPLIVRR